MKKNRFMWERVCYNFKNKCSLTRGGTLSPAWHRNNLRNFLRALQQNTALGAGRAKCRQVRSKLAHLAAEPASSSSGRGVGGKFDRKSTRIPNLSAEIFFFCRSYLQHGSTRTLDTNPYENLHLKTKKTTLSAVRFDDSKSICANFFE